MWPSSFAIRLWASLSGSHSLVGAFPEQNGWSRGGGGSRSNAPPVRMKFPGHCQQSRRLCQQPLGGAHLRSLPRSRGRATATPFRVSERVCGYTGSTAGSPHQSLAGRAFVGRGVAHVGVCASSLRCERGEKDVCCLSPWPFVHGCCWRCQGVCGGGGCPPRLSGEGGLVLRAPGHLHRACTLDAPSLAHAGHAPPPSWACVCGGRSVGRSHLARPCTSAVRPRLHPLRDS